MCRLGLNAHLKNLLIQFFEALVLDDRVFCLFLNEFDESLDRPLTSILAFGQHAIPNVLKRRVLGDVKPGAQIT